MKITLTVLVCVHSQDTFYDNLLINAIKSLENQTYKDFEVLFVLDQCWEFTKKIIDENCKLKYRVVVRDKKTGLHDAKNTGLSMIDSDYVCFLDADDEYVSTKLQKQIDYITEKEVDFLGTHSFNKYYDQNYLFPSCFDNLSYLTHSEIEEIIKNKNVLTHGSMMIRKKCLDDMGGYRKSLGSEDWDLWKRAFEKGYKFHQLSERLYIYTLNTSTSR